MRQQPILNIAHRGARSFAPENTVEAIEKAAQLGADAVEIDAQLSADGVAVVIHDDDLVRCTDARRRFPGRAPWLVSEFDAADLRALDAGSWFAAELQRPGPQRQSWLQSLTDAEREACITPADLARYASGSVSVPTLDECLDACHRLRLEAHIELKVIPRFYPQLAEKVVDAVARRGMHDAAVISSFDHQQLPAVRALAPRLRTAVLSADRLYRPAEYLERVGASAYNPGCYGDYDTVGFDAVSGRLDRETIAQVTARGYDVHVWTENDPARMHALIEAGVTGIFTDYPNRLRSVLAARGR